MSRERSYSSVRTQCRRRPPCSPARSPRRFPNYEDFEDMLSTPELVRNSLGPVGDGKDQSYLRAFDMDQLPGELLEAYEPPEFHDIPADSSFEEVMCILATPPPPPVVPTAAESLDDFRAEVAQVVGMDDLRKRMTAAVSEGGAPSVVCPIKALPDEVITVPPPPKDPKDFEALIKRARAIAKLKAIEEAKAAAAEAIAAAAAPPPPAKKVAKAPLVSRRVPAQKPAAGAQKPHQNVPPKVPQKAPPKPVPKAVQKVPPRAAQKPPPKVAPKAVPKVAPKAVPKVAPKAVPKVAPKAVPKVAPKAVPKAGPKTASQRPPPKTAEQRPPAKTAAQRPPPKTAAQGLPPKTAAQRPPPKTAAQRPPPKTAAQRPPTKTAAQIPPTKTAAQRGPATLKVPKPGIKRKGPSPQHPPGYVPPEYAKALLRTRKLAGIKVPTPTDLVVEPVPVSAEPVEATYESVLRRAAKLREKFGLSKQALADQMPPTRRRLSPYLRDDEDYDLEPKSEADIEDELDEFEALEELYNASASESVLEQDEAIVVELQDRIAALQQELLETPPPIFEVPAILRYEDLLRRREYLSHAAAKAGLIYREEMETEEETEEEEIPIRIIPPTPEKESERSLRTFDVRAHQAYLRVPDAMEGGDFPREERRRQARRPPPCEEFDDGLLEDFEQPEFAVSDLSPYAFSQEACLGEEFNKQISPPTHFGTPKVSLASSQFDEVYLEGIDMPEFDFAEAIQGFEVEDEFLGDISLPEYDADIPMEELGLGDVTPPDLCDLSISDTELALEPDYPLDITPIEAEAVAQQMAAESPKQQGFLTTMVNAVVDRVRNIFLPRDDQLEAREEDELNLDTSLPNLFATTPIPSKLPAPEQVVGEPVQAGEKRKTPEGPIVIPPHPKDPKDYKAIVRRAQAIQQKKAKEAAEAAAAAPPPPPEAKQKKGKREVKSTIPKKGPPPVKKAPPPKKAAPSKKAPPGKKAAPLGKKGKKEEKKVYPPGEYSPSDVRAVARARTLAGFKHYSDLLNPERVAKEKELKAAREAELARIELLPPVIRMRKKIELLKDRLPPAGAEVLPRPSIDLLGQLEAIRASLPIEKTKKKWKPTGRLRVDRRVKKPDRIFRKEHGRILIPTKKTQKKKGWKKLDVMSPIEEASPQAPQQFMEFSPLRAQEGRLRLRYLREEAAKRAAQIQEAAKEAEASICIETSPRGEPQDYASPELSPLELGPLINLLSPRTEETRRDKLVTTIGPNGGPETIREEVVETSVIDNGEVHTSTRKVTTKTDEFGNVTRHVQEGKGQSNQEEAMPDLADIEPPDFLDVSDIPPPVDPSIPTPGQIIDRIRANVRQKLQEAIPDIPQSPVPPSPGEIEFPEDITDEDLYETIIEFEESPVRVATPPRVLSPVVKDERLYALGERPPPTPPPPVVCPPSPKATPPPPEPVRPVSPSPPPKPKSPEEIIIPPHPKDPKDYKAIVRRAQAIQKLKKQQEALLAKLCPPPPTPPAKPAAGKAKKGGRVPISRWVAPPPKDAKKRKHKRIVLKKRVPKVSPKKVSPVKPIEDDDDREIPDEPPELSQEYRDAVARARLLRGLKNRTAALNPKVAAKLAAKKAAEEAARAAFEALPENEKIKVRMERLRRKPDKKRRVQASADILGTIAAIRANMPPIEEILREPSPPPPCPSPIREVPPSPRTPLDAHVKRYSPRAPIRVRSRSPSSSPTQTDKSIDDFEFMEQLMGAEPVTPQVCVPVQAEDLDASANIPDISSLRPYISPSGRRSPSPARSPPIPRTPRVRTPSPKRSPVAAVAPPADFLDLSLDEFERMETEALNMSLDEFEALEAEAQKVDMLSLQEFEAIEAEDPNLYDYTTPTRGVRHWGRNLAELFPRSPKDVRAVPSDRMGVIDLDSPELPPPRPYSSPEPYVPIPSMRQLALQGFFEEQEFSEEEDIVRPHISPRAGAPPGSLYYDLMEGFRVEEEEVVLDTSLLMPETPPKNIKEKLERIKKCSERRRSIPPAYVESIVSPTTPPIIYSPVKLISPSGAPCIISEQTSPFSAEDEMLIDVEAPPQRQVRALRDLEDLPFYGLEYEDEPVLEDISFEQPMTPPPRPIDIVEQIKSRVQDLRAQIRRSPPITPPMLPMPEEIPDEELMELSAPSFSATPPRTPSPKERSPRISLPMAWGEVRPPTPKTPTPRKPSPVRVPTPTPPPAPEDVEERLPPPVCIPEEGPIVIPPHPEDPRDYAAMVRRARAIQQLKKQEEAEEAAKAPPPEPPKKKGRQPISRWVEPPPKKKSKKPRKKLVMRKRVAKETKPKTPPPPPEEEDEDREIPAEPPELSQEYRDAVARARLLHGLVNRTAALNPEVAAKLAEFEALPEHEKIKVRMDRLRRKPGRRRVAQPTMEQLAFLEAMKQVGGYQLAPSPPKPPTPVVSPVAPKVVTPRRLSLSPQRGLAEYGELAEFEAQEEDVDFQILEAEAAAEAELQENAPREKIKILEDILICPPAISQENDMIQQRIANLEELLETEEMSEEGDVSLLEFEALEALEAPGEVCTPQVDAAALDIGQVISELQDEQLRTPPRIDPREKYRQLLAQRQRTPPSPVLSPIKTPDIHYSPLTLPSPTRSEITKRAEKSTTQVTRSGANTIKEQLIEKSEIVDGELQHITTHVTTTTDPQGNVTCQVNESKRVAARDPSAELEDLQDLGDVEEPSFLDTTPISPLERPRPADIIERVRQQVKERYRPEVPTGVLIELRTPPRELPLPDDITQEELLEYSFADIEEGALDESSVRTPVATQVADLSIPRIFEATPPTPTPPPRPVSPLRHRIPSPEGPIEIPPHPADPKDYRAICRRARKIQEFRAQEEAELRAAEEAAAAAAAAEAAKPKKKERVPISRWTAPPPKKPTKRKKLVMRKRGEKAVEKAAPPPLEEEIPEEPPALPEHFAEEVARARMLAGIKKKPPPHSPIKDFGDLQSRLAALREKGAVPRAQPSIAAASYLNAIKQAMKVRQEPVCSPEEGAAYESPKTRYQRIMAERAAVPSQVEESPIRTPPHEDIQYVPVRFVSPRAQEELTDIQEVDGDYALDMSGLQDLEELAAFEEPSFVDVSQYLSAEDADITIPTPPPQPAEIIHRIREQYQQAIERQESPLLSPAQLEFPEELPDEDLFELSAMSFAASPPRPATPVKSLDISFPRYFEPTPPPKVPTPPPRSPKAVSAAGVCPGVKVKTPEAAIQIPPHPKDPTDVAAMVRRAKIIQQLLAKAAAEKAAAEKAAEEKTAAGKPDRGKPVKKIKEPISKRTEPLPKPKPKPHKKGRLFKPIKLRKKTPAEIAAAEAAAAAAAAARPKKQFLLKKRQKGEADYATVIEKARKLQELKGKVAEPEDTTRPPPDYASIMERMAALRAVKQEIQKEPTARELATRQHLKNRQQRQERKRLLKELERLRAQQGYQEQIDLEPVKTPPPAMERLRAIKERVAIKVPAEPYSPVKTPEKIDTPDYRPIMLPPTPPCLFLQNVEVPQVEELSICEFVQDDFDTTVDESEIEDYEFQVAEAEAAQAAEAALSEAQYQQVDQIQIQSDFNMAQRLQNLEYQLQDEIAKEEELEFQMLELQAAAEAEAAAQAEARERHQIQILDNAILAPPRTQAAQGFTATQAFDVRNLLQVAENILMVPPTGYSPPTTSAVARERIDLEQRLKALKQHLQQQEQLAAIQYGPSEASEYDDSIDEFEALENQCL